MSHSPVRDAHADAEPQNPLGVDVGRQQSHNACMRRRVLSVLGVLVGAAAVAAIPAGASHSWGDYHWARTGNPFTLKVIDSVTSSWDGDLDAVEGDWSKSTVLDLAEEAGADDNSTRKRCKGVSGKIHACDAAYGFNGWLGVAQIWVSGGHILKAVAKVNDSYFSTSTYNNANAKRHVLCQEVGHTFGLGHQTAVSCMDDRNGLFDGAYVSPNQHDYDQLVTIYGSHTDSSSTVSSATTTSPTPGNGKGVQVDDSLYVEELGNGVRLYTWVYWVDPGVPHPQPPADA